MLFTKIGVYTKNRNFRLYKSSKAGKRTVFTVAGDNVFHAKPEKGVSAEESVFLASLICNVRYVHISIKCLFSEVLQSFDLCASLVSQVRESSHGRIQKQRKPKLHGPLTSREQTPIKVTFICQSVIVIFQYSIFNRLPPPVRSLSTELLSGSKSSPHQEVDNFVLTLVQKDGIQGSKCLFSCRR